MTQYTFLIVVLAVLFIAITFITYKGVCLSNEQYDRLKKIVMKWAGITTFLGVLVSTFSFAYGEETITVVAAVGAFLSYMMGVSEDNYKGKEK